MSGRISSRSSSVTPKITSKAHHNSADLHNSTASSGSHTFEQSQAPVYTNEMPDRADIHSESSVSGSRSLNSPKLDRGQSQDLERTPQHEAAMLVSEGVDEGEATMVTKEVPQEEEEGAYSDKLTNMLNINTNLDDVEVNEDYLDVVDNSIILTNMSANQNVNDNDDSQSRASIHLNSGDTELEPTNSISLPSELISASQDQSDSLSLHSDSKDLGFDQSDLSSHSCFSAEEIADLESCLQTISNIGCGELNSLVENVVELLPSVSRTANTNMDPVDTESNVSSLEGPELKQETNEIVTEEFTTLSHMMNTDDEMVCSVIEKSGNILDEQGAHEQEQISMPAYKFVDNTKQSMLVSDQKIDTHVGNGDIEPSSCIISTVKSTEINETRVKTAEDTIVKDLDTSYDLDLEDSEVKSVSDISDMLDDIPYYLHRRHIEGDEARMKETELYTALVNALNTAVSSDPGTSRRCRSLRRPPNMQIQQLKADEIPFQPRSSSTPGKRAPSKSPVRRSVRSERSSTEPRRSRKSAGSSHSRSPSGGRRIELVNFHKLPKKDNFSSVDDTASPPKEEDIVAQFGKYRDTSSDMEDKSFDESVSFEKSPITESDVEGNISGTQLVSESDSMRALSDGSMSLTHSSMSINESETSQGSYSLSDLNLSRDEMYDMAHEMDSFDGSKKDTISLDDLDLPFIDSFDESDIISSEMCHLGSSTSRQHPLEKKCESNIQTETSTSESSHDILNTSAIDKIESQKSCESPLSTDDKHVENDINVDKPNIDAAPSRYEETHFSADDVAVALKHSTSEATEAVTETSTGSQVLNHKTASKPLLKPLDIPVKVERHKSSKEAEWEALMKELKEADERSPDDLHPSDLLLSLSAERSRADAKQTFRKMNLHEESSIDELDELLLQTTVFNNDDQSQAYEGLDLAASILLSNSSGQPYTRLHDRQNVQFSTFKPADSPLEYQANTNLVAVGGYGGVVTVTLSHDIEDIQMEEKSISNIFDMPHEDESKQNRGRSLTATHHAVIKRSLSPRRLVEYTAATVKQVEIKGNSENEIGIHPKRHSYHGETLDSVQIRRKRLEPKRVSFHETVEEITAEPYQSSSSSGEDRNSGSENGNNSDVTSPDMVTSSSANSDLCYSPVDPVRDQRGQSDLNDKGTIISTGNLSCLENPYSNGETSGTESDDESSSDEAERDRVDEFLKFAQSLADCGKDYATDSGVGDSIANTTEVSPCDPQYRQEHLDEYDDDDTNVHDNDDSNVNTVVNSKDITETQNFEDASSSSSSSDNVADINKKRPSIDPLESLEQLHDSYVSSDDESFEGEATNALDID